MVDAGSSGTRAHIYKWEKTRGIPNVEPVPSKENGFVLKQNIPIAKAHKNITIISDIFEHIIKFAVERIPSLHIPNTRIFVYATAGVRLLSEADRDFVINQTYEYLATHSPFKLKRKYVRCITGVEEGIYGWLSVNHLKGTLKTRKTIGALDMGGASSQIAVQMKKSTNSKHEHFVNLGFKTIKIFVYSYLGYGANEALKTVSKHLIQLNETSHPCYPIGCHNTYKNTSFIGTGDFDKCSELISEFLLEKPDFRNIIVPHETDDYVAMAAYYYLNSFLRLPSNSLLSQLKQASIDFCSKNYSLTLEEYPDNPYVINYCWYAVYQWNTFVNGFKFEDGKTTIIKADDIDGVDLSWTIGATLKEASEIEFDERSFLNIGPIFLMNVYFLCYLTYFYHKSKKEF